MTSVIRWFVVAVVALHGLIHLLGALKGFGWSEVSALKQPIGPVVGAVWLLATVLLLASAGLIAADTRTWWWVVALTAAAVSQAAIATSWDDAKFGTAVNVLLVLVAAYGFCSVGPVSFRAQWEDQSTSALAQTDHAPALLTLQDLVDLPAPLAAYVRRSGAVGRERVTSFEAAFHGRIRSGPTRAWMPFTGRQVNTFGPRPQRVFIMDATRSGLPVTILHQFGNATATMRARVLSVVPVVNAAGPEMDRGETVTVFNDLVVLAPGAIIDAPVRWTPIDANHVRGDYTDSGQIVSAVLTFNADHDLVDFVSHDRSRASSDGTTFTPQTWSTPLSEHRDRDGRRVLAIGEGRWAAPRPEGSFAYIEFHLDDIAYNVRDHDTEAPNSQPPEMSDSTARDLRLSQLRALRGTVETSTRGSTP